MYRAFFSGEIKETSSSVECAIESELYPNVAIGSKKDTTWLSTHLAPNIMVRA